MKNKNRISQLTLELYYRGLTTKKERKLVEEALAADSEVRKQYEALQKSDKEIRRLVMQELNKLNKKELPPVTFPQRKKLVAGLLLAAAILVCVLVPVFLYFKNSNSTTINTIAEETKESVIEEIIDDTSSEPSKISESDNSNEIIEKPESRIIITEEPAEKTQPKTEPESGVYIAIETPPDTGIRTRGGELTEPKTETVIITDEQSNINIPLGMSFIFDNMFANRDLSFAVIPSRIKTIGKNAFSGNPLLSVTIGEGVSIEENAIPGNFAAVYNNGGKIAGTYTRQDINSDWEKK